MSHIFVSYSRTNTDFVHRLHEAFAEREHETWVDWEGIPPSDKWMESIHAAIDEAAAFLFVISPDSIASEVCGQELDYAIQHHKRLIPVLYREPEAPVRPELAEINYIFARETDPFEDAVETIIGAVDTDLEWVRAHTRLLVRTVEWDRLGRDPSYTLRGKDLVAFEEWATQAPDKEPKPTVLQSEYLLASRRAVTRRQRIIWTSVAAGLCIAVALGMVAWFQNRERNRQAEIASARQLLSRAEALRDIPEDDRNAHTQHQAGLRLATSALQALDRLGEPTFDADQSVRKSYDQMSKWTESNLGPVGIRDSGFGFDPSGRYVGYYTTQAEIVVRDTISGEVTASCKRTGHMMDSQFGLALAADGQRLALHVYNASSADPTNTISVWSLSDCRVLLEQRFAGAEGVSSALRSFALTKDGQSLLALLPDGLYLWDVASGAMRRVDSKIRMLAFALSSDGTQIAAYERIRGDRRGWIRIRMLATGKVLSEWQIDGRVYSMKWIAAGLFVNNGGKTLYAIDGQKLFSWKISGVQVVISNDGQYFVARELYGKLRIIDTGSGEVVAHDLRDAQYDDITFRPDGRSVFVVGKYGVDLGIWHFAASGALAVLEPGGDPLWVWFPARSNELRVADEQGEAIWQLPGPGTDAVPALMKNTLDTTSRLKLPVEPEPPKQDGERLVLAEIVGRSGRKAMIVAREITRAGYRRTLEVWDGGKKQAEKAYEAVFEGGRESFLQFVGQDRYVVIGTRTGLEMVDAGTLEPVATLYHTGAILAGAQPDGRRAVTMDAKRSIRVWEIASGQEVARITADHAARALELSDDGRWLAALGTDGRVRLWAIAPGDLIAQACQWLKNPCP